MLRFKYYRVSYLVDDIEMRCKVDAANMRECKSIIKNDKNCPAYGCPIIGIYRIYSVVQNPNKTA